MAAHDKRHEEEIYRQEVEARIAEEKVCSSDDLPPDPPPDFVERCLNANELGDGLLFAFLFHRKHRYVGQMAQWIYFDKHHWRLDEIGDASKALADVESVALIYDREAKSCAARGREAENSGDKDAAKSLARKAKAFTSRSNRLRTTGGRKSCLDFAKSNLEIPCAIGGSEIDRDPWSLPVANGVLDLRTGELKRGRPEDYLMKSSPIEWQGIDAPCPEWEKAVLEMMDGDSEMVSFLRRVFGYGITGLSREHIFLVLCGKGRNGKSIMADIIREVLGGTTGEDPLAAPIQSEMLLDQGKNRSSAGPSPDIMALRGIRIAFASETDEGQKFSPARVKWLSGGDALVGRFPHDKRNISFSPTHLLCLLTNHKPVAPASDFPFWERLLLVEYPISFVDRKPQNDRERPMDKRLKDKLMRELPGILAWLVRGCLEWQDTGLAAPPKVLEATAAYRDSQDDLATFVEDCCTVNREDATLRTSATLLFDAFTIWYRENISAKYKVSQKRFGQLMMEKFTREKVGGYYYYFGIALTEGMLERVEDARSHDRS